jgi:hypothetical protein
MYQRGTIPTSVTGSPDVTARWRKALVGSWPRLFNPTLYLPDSLASFLIFMLGLAGISVALGLHLLLSAQIMTAEVQLENLSIEHDLINRQNMEIIWQTSQHASLPNVQARAAELGYQVMPEKVYRLRRPALTTTNGKLGAAPAPFTSGPDTIPDLNRGAKADPSTVSEQPTPLQRIQLSLARLGERWQGWVDAARN